MNIEQFSQRLANFVITKPIFTVIFSLILFASCISGAQYLQFSNTYRIFFSDQNPELQNFDNFLDNYSKNDLALIVIHNPSGDVFNHEYLSTIEWATEEAWQLPFTTRVDSVTNFQYSYGEDDELFVENLVEEASNLSPSELQQKKLNAITEPILAGNIISHDADTTAIAVTVNLPEKSMDEVPALAASVRELSQKIQTKIPDAHIALSGVVMLNNAFSEASLNDMQGLIPLMYALLALMTIISLKSFFAAISALVVVMFSMLIALGLAGFVGIPLSPVSVSAPTIIMTLAIADSIHILISMLTAYRSGKSKHEAIAESIRINFIPVSLTSITTIIGFLTLNFSDAPPYWHLGNITAMGIAAAWLLSLTLLPALMALLPIKQSLSSHSNAQHSLEPYLSTLAQFITRHHYKILAVGSLIIIAIASGVQKIELNDEFVKYFGEDIQFRQDADFTTENLSGLYIIEYDIPSGKSNGINNNVYLNDVENFANWMRAQPEVKHVYAHTDIIKRLNRNMHDEDASHYAVPINNDEAAQYLLLYEFSLPQGLDLQNRITIDKSGTRLTAILDTISSLELQQLNERAKAWQQENMQVMHQSNATGTAVMFSYISKRNVESMMIGNVIAIAFIGIIMTLALMSFKLGIISVFANGLPIIIMFGIWGLLVGKVGMVASGVAASTLGIVVDDTVHFLSKYLRAIKEQGMSKAQAIEYTFSTVGVAIISTTVILTVGFGVLYFSDFQLNQQTGLMSAITIVIALIFDLLFLPAILMLGKNKQSERHTGGN